MAVHILKIPDWQRYSDIITENDEYEMVISLKQDGNNAVSPIVERVYRDLYTAAVEVAVDVADGDALQLGSGGQQPGRAMAVVAI